LVGATGARISRVWHRGYGIHRVEPPRQPATSASGHRAKTGAGRSAAGAARRMTVRSAVVIGPTAWGTTLAVLLARNGVRTTLLARYEDVAQQLRADRENKRRLPGTPFPNLLDVTADS